MAESESIESATLVSCTASLELALRSDRNIAHYLFKESFIKQDIYDDVNDPKSRLSTAEKAGVLVTGIKNTVELNPNRYHKLTAHLRNSPRRYGDIIKILNDTYATLKDREWEEEHKVGHRSPQPADEAPTSSECSLSVADHSEVYESLKCLTNEQLIRLGLTLGLLYANLKRMMDLPNEMIHAWLISTDNVIEKSGTPSWSALITALEDIGQGGIALSIKKGKTYCLGKRRQCNTSAKSEDYPKRINSNITDKVLMSISRECGSKYVELGIGLGLEYKTIMNRLSQHEGKSDHMKAFEVLQEWKGRNFSCEMLAEALEEVGLKEIALKYCYEL